MSERKHETAQRDSFNEHGIVASASECTGLIPALSREDPDAELNEAMLYGVHAPKQNKRNRRETCRDGKGEGASR